MSTPQTDKLWGLNQQPRIPTPPPAPITAKKIEKEKR